MGSQPCLNHHLRLRTRAAAMGTVGVARELEHLVGRQLEDVLEPTAKRRQDFLALLGRPALAASNVAIPAAGDVPACGAGPDADTVECLADVDDNAHHLAILLVLQRLADGAEHGMQPELIDVDRPLVLELERPLAAVLVLGILPLRTHTLLEEVVIRLEGKFGDWRDVVLVSGLVREHTTERERARGEGAGCLT